MDAQAASPAQATSIEAARHACAGLVGGVVNIFMEARYPRAVATVTGYRAPGGFYTASMYAAVLSRKYLTTKAIPLLAALAVTLSVATELIVWSVMGGFLTMLVDEGRKTDGDLRITWEHVGFGHYEDLVERLEADPAIAHATPMIETLAILGMPDDRPVSVQLLGIEPASYAEATVYGQSLYWRPMEIDGEQPLVD